MTSKKQGRIMAWTAVKLILGTLMLVAAYFLFRYAAQTGDWGFVTEPIKNLFKSM